MQGVMCRSVAAATRLLSAIVAFLPLASLFAQGFQLDADLQRVPEDSGRLTVTIQAPPQHLVYADSVSVEVESPAALTPESAPEPVIKNDPLLDEDRAVFTGNVAFVYSVSPMPVSEPLIVKTSLMGCNDTVCFPPQDQTWRLLPDQATNIGVFEVSEIPPESGGHAPGWLELAKGFSISASHAGYLASSDFITFLSKPSKHEGGGRGIWLTMLLILFGGLALNLTPCVLPMIPVNIAILGAGVGAGSKNGFGLGLLYGAGMSLAYGVVGLVAVLTGTAFGSLNASPFFNLGIAVLFAILALAMFGVYSLDFSALQSRISAERLGAGRALTAFFAGAIAALLAGACVAPVVISVLVLTSNLYAGGLMAALLLPFLLGIGMALPWPFVGAGLSILPKPGKWMEWVKVAFGVFILGFALYYAWTGFSLLRARQAPTAQFHDAGLTDWHDDLTAGIEEATRTGKSVFVDFWASWCKSCALMERTTFQDAEVLVALEPYVKIRYQAEFPNQSPSREVLSYFNVKGLPTFLILAPKLQEHAPDENK